LTAAIMRLEQALGSALFERKPAVRITVLGHAVRPYLQRIAENADLAEHCTTSGQCAAGGSGGRADHLRSGSIVIERAVMRCARSSFCCNSRYRRGFCPLVNRYHVRPAKSYVPRSVHRGAGAGFAPRDHDQTGRKPPGRILGPAAAAGGDSAM